MSKIDQYGFNTQWIHPEVQASVYRQFATKSALSQGEKEYILSHTAADEGFCRRLVERLAKYLRRTDSVLSVAEGDGHLLRALMDRGFRDVLGVDICAELVALGQAKGVNLQQADATRLPFENNTFDAVVINEAIGALGLTDALLETRRVLKPLGKLIITTYNYTEYRRKDVFNTKMKYRYLTSGVILKALRDKKFAKVAMTSIPIEPESTGFKEDRMDMIIAEKLRYQR